MTIAAAAPRIKSPAPASFAEYRAQVDCYLSDLIAVRYPGADAEEARLAEAAAYAVLGGGKRVRPLLTIAAAELFRPVDEEVIALATTTELIHAASLLLDDLPSMDDARLRRGRPAAHLVFGEATTILIALALWSEAARILSTVQSSEIRAMVNELAEAAGGKGLVRGQLIDLTSGSRVHDLARLEECSYLKTGVLFRSAVKLGALAGGASAEHSALLEAFSREFGVAYQVRDDLLDAEAAESETGKDAGADQRNGRTTFVTLLGASGARAYFEDRIERARGILAGLPGGAVRLASLLPALSRT